MTASELTLAWIIAQGFIAIPRTRKIKYLDSNFSAVKFQLTPEEIQDIRQVSKAADVAGEIYPAPMMLTTNP